MRDSRWVQASQESIGSGTLIAYRRLRDKPKEAKMEDTLGLVMTGGGARGAYQAGVP
jgi:predicted acylesterase/phospholipase RssA